MAWSPLAGGHLRAEASTGLSARMDELGRAAGADWTAVAVAWLLHHPAQVVPGLGTNTLSRIVRISDALSVPMDRQTWFELYTLAQGHEVP